MYLSTEKSPFRNDFLFSPVHLPICDLKFREAKDIASILNNFHGDSYIATILDLIIRNDQGTAYDPVRDEENHSDVICFFSPLRNKKHELPSTEHDISTKLSPTSPFHFGAATPSLVTPLQPKKRSASHSDILSTRPKPVGGTIPKTRNVKYSKVTKAGVNI